MKQLELRAVPKGHWYIVRPVAFVDHGVSQGYLVDADSEAEAWRIGEQTWGEIESVGLDDV